MPEMRFRVRWPNGDEENCYSPSFVIKDFFAPGATYPLSEFLAMSRNALTIASDRVKARYGFPCSRALDQLQRIEAIGRALGADPAAQVIVVSFQE